eukprot:scaffold74986_cov26-Tisochrysis_lutea.AAC.4
MVGILKSFFGAFGLGVSKRTSVGVSPVQREGRAARSPPQFHTWQSRANLPLPTTMLVVSRCYNARRSSSCNAFTM